MKQVMLKELGGSREFQLTEAQANRLRESGLAEVKRGSRSDLWRVRAGRFVGAARVGSAVDGLELRIEPKIAVARLLFLIGYAEQRQEWQQDEIAVREAEGLLPVVAHAFARSADRALRQGTLLGYHDVVDAGPALMGRIREADQVRRRYGLPLPLEVTYQDPTPDIPENQLLLAAAKRLLKLPDVYRTTRAMLRRLLIRLDAVSRLTPGRPLPPWYPTRLNRRYQTALGLAELVLRGGSYELDEGGSGLRADGPLVLDMWRIFEKFVTVALTAALRPHGGQCTPQDTRHHLDAGHLFQLIPDLVYNRPGPGGPCAPVAVIDAKYVIETGSSVHRDHVYQVLAYCVAARARRGYIVYAEGPAEPSVHRIHGTDIEIVQFPLDLSQQPADLFNQVTRLATRIAETSNET